MGDIADAMLEGDLCEWCGEAMDGDGYAQVCAGCKRQDAYEKKQKKKKKKGKKKNG